MTKEQIQRRTLMTKWKRLQKRAANAPHGKTKERQAELRAFVRESLKRAA